MMCIAEGILVLIRIPVRRPGDGSGSKALAASSGHEVNFQNPLGRRELLEAVHIHNVRKKKYRESGI